MDVSDSNHTEVTTADTYLGDPEAGVHPRTHALLGHDFVDRWVCVERLIDHLGLLPGLRLLAVNIIREGGKQLLENSAGNVDATQVISRVVRRQYENTHSKILKVL